MNILDEKAIKEFQEAYYADFGVHIDKKEALEVATRLLEVFSVIYKPITNNPHENA